MRLARMIAVAALLVAAAIGSHLAATEIPQAERRSGFSFMSPDTQAIQNDDTSNPGMLSVLDGEKLWNDNANPANKACADCHHDVAGMKGVAARYPAFDPTHQSMSGATSAGNAIGV
jgi:L-cysteine S-thiosulfotransferase